MRVDRGENELFVGDADIEMGNDRIRQPGGVENTGNRGDHLGRHLLAQPDVFLEGIVDTANKGFGGRGGGRFLDQLLDISEERFVVGDKIENAGPTPPFHQHLNRAVGELQHLDDLAEGADVVKVFFGGVVHLGIFLGGEKEGLVPFHRPFDRLDRLGATDEQRNHHMRKDHDIP